MLTRFSAASVLCALASIQWSACSSQVLAQSEGEGAALEPGASQAERIAWLDERLRALATPAASMGDGQVGIVVMEAGSGRAIFEERADESTHVASNVKLLTTAATLARLGPNFRFRTSVLAERVDLAGEVQGDLYLRGRGDPVFDAGDIDDMVAELARTGITGVRGRVIVDDSYLGGSITPPHFNDFEEPLDQHARYRAPVAGLTIERGTFRVIIAPSRSGKGAAQVTIDPPSDYIQVAENQVMTQIDGRVRLGLEIEIANDRMKVRVRGQVRAFSRPTRYRFRVEDPALHAGHVFERALEERGIRVRGRVERGVTSPGARVLTTVVSPPLAVLVRRLGKRSDNAVAEALLAALGAERVAADENRPATWDDGLDQLRDFLVKDIGFPDDDRFHVDNGSGLYGQTLLSPNHLARVLRAAYLDPRYGPDFMASLSIAGIDGTLRRRMRGSRARGLIRAKTGTLGSVSALSGYASTPGGETLIFAIVHSGLPRTSGAKNRARRAARVAQNQMADAIMEYLDSARPPTPAGGAGPDESADDADDASDDGPDDEDAEGDDGDDDDPSP